MVSWEVGYNPAVNPLAGCGSGRTGPLLDDTPHPELGVSSSSFVTSILSSGITTIEQISKVYIKKIDSLYDSTPKSMLKDQDKTHHHYHCCLSSVSVLDLE